MPRTPCERESPAHCAIGINRAELDTSEGNSGLTCCIGFRCAGRASPLKILPSTPIESIRTYWCSMSMSVSSSQPHGCFRRDRCAKRISIDQLKIGMKVEKLDRSWLATPFLRHRFTITSSEQIEQLHASGVQQLDVDADDVVPGLRLVRAGYAGGG